MSSKEITEFIEFMRAYGETWDESQVESVYRGWDIADAINDRKNFLHNSTMEKLKNKIKK